MKIEISNHAERRFQQRGFRDRDMGLLVRLGTWLDDHCVLMRNKDVDREIANRKQEIQVLERLRGCKVVCRGDIIVTAYRPTRARLRRDIRAASSL